MSPTFAIKVTDAGENETRVIQLISDLFGLSSLEVEERLNDDGIVADGLDRATAERQRERLQAAGATVETILQSPEHRGGSRLVRGVVRTGERVPVAGVHVRVFHREDLRTDVRLRDGRDTTRTDVDGRYEVHYSTDELESAGADRVNLFVRAYNALDEDVAESDVVFDAAADESIDLVVDPDATTQLSEYVRLLLEVGPALGGESIASLSDEERAFVVNDTDLDARDGEFPAGAESLAVLADSTRFASETGLPTVLFYGLGRKGASLDPESLSAAAPDALRRTLVGAIDDGIVPELTEEELDTVFDRLEETDLEIDREPPRRHRFSGRVLTGDDEEETPVAGHRVRLTVPDGESHGSNSVSTVTGRSGRFTVTYVRRADDPDPDELTLQVLDTSDEVVLTRPFRDVSPAEGADVEIRIPGAALPAHLAVPLAELREQTGLVMSRPEIDALADHGVHSIADVRRLGLPDGIGDSTAASLRAHAVLNLLPTSPAIDAELIERGFTHPALIAETPRRTFVDSVTGETLSEQDAETVFQAAVAITRFAKSRHTASRADWRNTIGRQTSIEAAGPGEEDGTTDADFPRHCSCEACETAVTPRAYLADLLDYTLDSLVLTDDGGAGGDDAGPVSIDFLTDTFFQPFVRLLESCDTAEDRVRNARLCGEVLLQYLGEEDLQTAAIEDSDEYEALLAYRLDAYRGLLSQLGTSYEELRDVVDNGNADDEELLANRLGIPIERLPELLLSPSAPPATERAVSETNLESLFGLQAFTDAVSTDQFAVPDETALLYVGQTGVMSGFDPEESVQLRRRLPDGTSLDVRTVDADEAGTVTITLSDADVGDGGGAIGLSVEGGSRAIPFTGSSADPADTRILVLDPLRHAGTSLPEQSLVHAWQLDTARESWRNHDHPPDVYPTETHPIIDPDLVGPDDFRTPDPDEEPANDVAHRAFSLWMQRREWADTRLQVLRDLVATAEGHVLEELLGRMDESMRYGIDETLASLEDIEGVGPARAEQLTTAGFGTVDAVARASREELENVDGINESLVDQILSSVHVGPDGAWPDGVDLDRLNALLDVLVAEEATARDEATDAIAEELHLGIEAFERLMELSKRYERWHSGVSREELEPDEWEEIYSILVQAQKTSLFPAWIREETQRSILLGPRSFWISLSEPDTGTWPAALDEESAIELETPSERAPYVDPEIVSKDDLPDPVAGRAARELWTARSIELNDTRAELEETYRDDGFESLLADVYGDLHVDLTDEEFDGEEPWASYFAARFADLETGLQPDLERIARDAEALHLSIEQFEQLAAMGKYAIDSGGEPPSDPALTMLVAELTTAWKRRTKYPAADADVDADPGVWIREEEEAQVRTYWRARKARLPRWRADKASRQAWQTTLRTHSRPPVLDPNLVVEADLATPSVGDTTFELLVERRDQLGQLRERVTDERSSVDDPEAVPDVTVEQFDAMLAVAMGISTADIEALVEADARGEGISGRLEQFTLSRPAFTYLADVDDRIDVDEDDGSVAPIVEEEWRNVDSILTQGWKERLFATWRETEEARGLSLSPAFFTREEPGEILDQQALAPHERWLSDEERRRDWERTLDARIDQQEGIAAALGTAVDETEEDAVPGFRDGLVDAIETPAVSDPAAWLSDRLRLDVQTDGCQETTRASQAIDVLQGLVFALETGTGLELPEGIALQLSNDDHDEQWQWMQSYANWKAAMLVFMYPENFLLPTFRETQTPVFRDLVGELGSGANVTPSRARRAADQYTDYLRDVFSLRVEAICSTRVTLEAGAASGDEAEQTPKDLVYMFAQGDETDALYWSVYDGSNDESRAQSYWKPLLSIPEETLDLDVLGATVNPERHSNGAMFLFLRRWQRGSETPELVYATFDLDEQRWQEGDQDIELVPISLPLTRYFNARLVQGCTVPQIFLSFNAYTGVDYLLTYTGEAAATAAGDGEDENESETDSDGWEVTGISRLGGELYTELLAAVAVPPGISDMVATDGRPTSGLGRVPDYKIVLFKRTTATSGPGYELSARVIRNSRVLTDWSPFATNVDRDAWQGALIGVPAGAGLHHSVHADREGGVHAFWKDETGASVHSVLRIESTRRMAASGSGRSSRELRGRDPSVVPTSFAAFSPGRPAFARVAGDWVWQPPEGDVIWQPPPPPPPLWEWHVSYSNPIPSFVAGEDDDIRFAVATMRGGSPDLVVYQLRSDGDVTGSKRVRVGLFDPGIPARADTAYFTAPVGSTGSVPAIEQNVQDVAGRRARFAALHQDNLVPNVHQTYLNEAYYFLPLHLALQLQRGSHYEDALNWLRTIYDYSAGTDRKISYLLVQEAAPGTTPVHERPDEWLYSGINPHAYASLRTTAYTRYTLFTIAKCLSDFADQEFAQDTAEAVSRARTLYRTALTTLASEGLHGVEDPCDTIRLTIEEQESTPTGTLQLAVRVGGSETSIQVTPDERDHARVALAALGDELAAIRDLDLRRAAASEIVTVLDGDGDPSVLDRIATATEAVDRIASAGEESTAFDVLLRTDAGRGTVPYASVLRDPGTAYTAARIGAITSRTLSRPFTLRAEADGGVLEEQPPDVDLAGTFAGTQPVANVADVPVGAFINQFCLPENPVLSALRARAELGLHKIRTCRNIAGMERELEPYAAPVDVESGLPAFGGGQLPLPGVTTIQPTAYRYGTLIERTKEIVGVARQMEADFLRFLERRDDEAFRLLEAQQGIQQARANVRLQGLRVEHAREEITLAELQKESARMRVDHFMGLLDEGWLWEEQTAIGFMTAAAALHTSAGVLFGGQAFWDTAKAVATFGLFGNSAGSAAQMASAFAAASSTTAEIFNTWASYERREQEWRFQRSLAEQDVAIGNTQVTLAEDHLRVVGQERHIAELHTDHAEAIVGFLTEKFTSEELYDWMADVLEDVYRYFLQQATSMARLAEHQLAFERQETPPQFVQTDYWEPPRENAIGDIDATTPDRRGLTGAERLLQDVYELDQYAFSTDERKLHLKKTLSLARLAPLEFQEFRDTGVMTFGTPMELFDRDHPGHYLRLVKRVNVSVIALTPPTDGVHATLTASGISRVVTPGATFQPRIVRRPPESIALSAPHSEETLLELREESDEMLLPFEKTGVDTTWEFRMPEASNQFDFDSIADVLVTVHYTALDSHDYRQEVIEALGTEASGERAFSFRETFADQWYDLNNPDTDPARRTDGDPAPMTVRFETTRDDFPPNVDEVGIDHVLLYFVGEGGRALDGHGIELRFDDGSGRGPVGGSASPVDGRISTRRTNGIDWSSIAEAAGSASGEWTLSLPHPETRITHPEVDRVGDLFTEGAIEDVLFVITYSGRHPDWPE